MARLDWKRKLGKIWPAWHIRGRKIILLYHSIGNSLWAISEQVFTDQINWLYDQCRILPLTKLIKAQPSNDIQVAVSFDDGYASVFGKVAPQLVEKKIFPMLYINTGWISDSESCRRQSVAALGHYPDESFLTWKEVNALYATGWEIGSHGINHYDFSCSESKITEYELTTSKQNIEMRLHTDCSHFSYPWGKHSPKVKKMVQAVGYKYAVGGRHAAVTPNSDLFAIPRINISKEYSFEDFKEIIKGKWDYLGLIHQIKGL